MGGIVSVDVVACVGDPVGGTIPRDDEELAHPSEVLVTQGVAVERGIATRFSTPPRLTAVQPDRLDKLQRSRDRAPRVAGRVIPDSHQPAQDAETFLATAVAHGEHTEDHHRLYSP